MKHFTGAGRQFWKAKGNNRTYYIVGMENRYDAALKSISAFLKAKVIGMSGYVEGNKLICADISEFPKNRGDYIPVWVFSRK